MTLTFVGPPQMPVLDGLSATREIRRSEREEGRPPVRVVGLTGNARSEQIQLALEAGLWCVWPTLVAHRH